MLAPDPLQYDSDGRLKELCLWQAQLFILRLAMSLQYFFLPLHHGMHHLLTIIFSFLMLIYGVILATARY